MLVEYFTQDGKRKAYFRITMKRALKEYKKRQLSTKGACGGFYWKGGKSYWIGTGKIAKIE